MEAKSYIDPKAQTRADADKDKKYDADKDPRTYSITTTVTDARGHELYNHTVQNIPHGDIFEDDVPKHPGVAAILSAAGKHMLPKDGEQATQRTVSRPEKNDPKDPRPAAAYRRPQASDLENPRERIGTARAQENADKALGFADPEHATPAKEEGTAGIDPCDEKQIQEKRAAADLNQSGAR